MENEIEDVVVTLGFLTLGTRFKRLGEQLQAETQRILAALDTPVPVGQFPLLAALDRLGPLTVGEAAAAIGITQPGATRSLNQLVALGMVAPIEDACDRRRRVHGLTAAGTDLVARSKAGPWARVETAVRSLCGDLDGPLLAQLAMIEQRLAGRSLDEHAGPT